MVSEIVGIEFSTCNLLLGLFPPETTGNGDHPTEIVAGNAAPGKKTASKTANESKCKCK